MSQKHYKNVKNASHNHCQCLLLYKLAEQWTSGLGRFLQCRKCSILVITQAPVLCLIYMHSPLGTARHWALCVYIRQNTLACVITYTYIHTYMYIILYICTLFPASSYHSGVYKHFNQLATLKCFLSIGNPYTFSP